MSETRSSTGIAISSRRTMKRAISGRGAASGLQPCPPQTRNAIRREVLELRRYHLEHPVVAHIQYYGIVVHVFLEIGEDRLPLIHVEFRQKIGVHLVDIRIILGLRDAVRPDAHQLGWPFVWLDAKTMSPEMPTLLLEPKRRDGRPIGDLHVDLDSDLAKLLLE